MNIIQTDIPGVVIIEPRVFGDERGYSMESFYTGAVRAGGVPYGIRPGQRVLLPLRCASRLALPVAASQSKQIGARRRRARGGFRRGYSA